MVTLPLEWKQPRVEGVQTDKGRKCMCTWEGAREASKLFSFEGCIYKGLQRGLAI